MRKSYLFYWATYVVAHEAFRQHWHNTCCHVAVMIYEILLQGRYIVKSMVNDEKHVVVRLLDFLQANYICIGT
jgi:hypothetical protein